MPTPQSSLPPCPAASDVAKATLKRSRRCWWRTSTGAAVGLRRPADSIPAASHGRHKALSGLLDTTNPTQKMPFAPHRSPSHSPCPNRRSAAEKRRAHPPRLQRLQPSMQAGRPNTSLHPQGGCAASEVPMPTELPSGSGALQAAVNHPIRNSERPKTNSERPKPNFHRPIRDSVQAIPNFE